MMRLTDLLRLPPVGTTTVVTTTTLCEQVFAASDRLAELSEVASEAARLLPGQRALVVDDLRRARMALLDAAGVLAGRELDGPPLCDYCGGVGCVSPVLLRDTARPESARVASTQVCPWCSGEGVRRAGGA